MEYPLTADPLAEHSAVDLSGGRQKTELSERPGLCLSGGGYRATLFHIGAIRRLNQGGLLPKIERISSVSGGSITAGALAACWRDLAFDENGVAQNLEEKFTSPLLAFTDRTIDIPNILMGILPGISATKRVARTYDKHLFRGKTLQDLPDDPIFVINATNMHSGVLWRFSKPYSADYRVGMIRNPMITLAEAVAASSAFPPILSPVRLDLREYKIEKTKGADLHHAPFTKSAALTDGGVYDNLGLETVFKRHKTVLVSNGGSSIPDFPSGFNLWSTQLRRIITIMNGQHDSLRIRQLIDAFKSGDRNGAYWGLNTRLGAPVSAGTFTIDDIAVREGEAIRTRLNRFSNAEKEKLITLGYCLSERALKDSNLL